MTEQQAYRVLETRGDVELRAYAPCVVADVVVPGSAEQAANAAFRPLFAYISGANRSASPLAMTAPVIQQAAGERLAMTAPVLQESAGPSQWTVSFVLPASVTLADAPAPTDPRVSIRGVAEERAAALRWSGRWTSANIDRRTQELRRAIEDAGWRISGAPRWARFDRRGSRPSRAATRSSSPSMRVRTRPRPPLPR